MLKGIKILSKRPEIVTGCKSMVRSKYSDEVIGLKLKNVSQTTSTSSFHQSQAQEYPAVKPLPLPPNIKDLPASEKLKFSPQRSREISGSYISSATADGTKNLTFEDNDIIECYDCSGAISLSSVMQTNVPYPFVSKGKPTHLNMPGGQWSQDEKYTSEDLKNVHHTSNKDLNVSTGGTSSLGFKKQNQHSYLHFHNRDLKIYGSQFPVYQLRNLCTVKEKIQDENSVPKPIQLTNKDKLKNAVKDYGGVVLVFHVGISLISLGCCYVVVASGIDLSSIMKDWGMDEGASTAGVATQFIVAYAVHKAMAPGRIALTLASVPFIVKRLRKIGFLKPIAPKPK